MFLYMEVFTYYFWTFMIGSVLGVIIETLWCIYKYRKIESRKGLIFGPFNPLYGVATVFLSFSINCVTNRGPGNIFLIGVVVASVLEYLCSYYQEKITGTISWNYEKFRFNLNGRINLAYSFIWGFLTIIWFNSFMPIIDSYMPILNSHRIFTIIAFILMIFNCVISILAGVRRKQRRENIYAHTKLEKHLDYFYNDKLMDKIYPNSEFVDD